MKKILSLIGTALLLAPLLARAEPLLITAEQLAKAPEHYRILDTRGQLAYLSGHIPGAQRVEWKDLSNMAGGPGDELWAGLNDTGKLQGALRQLGLNADSQVVVYAAPPAGWGEDGRIAWTLKAAGIDQVQLLDGGINAWKALKLPLNRLPESAPASQFELGALNPSASIETAALKNQLGQVTLIDTRAADEFAGAINFGEARGGHLPGAINIPFTELLKDDGSAKSAAAIQALLAAKGIGTDEAIVTYCTAGVRSAHSQLLLENAGFSNVKNYSNGFYHWAASSELPLE